MANPLTTHSICFGLKNRQEINRERIFGKRTVHRINPQTGQDEYYYLDPRGAKTFAEMKEIPVPSENSPNPFANEIQNYLYEHDDYN